MLQIVFVVSLYQISHFIKFKASSASRIYRKKGKKKKGKKRGVQKTALRKKKGKLKKNKKRAFEGQILFWWKIRAGNSVKATKSGNFPEKREKTALQVKKGFSTEKKRRGEKGHFEKCALRKKKGRTKRKKRRAEPFFFVQKNLPFFRYSLPNIQVCFYNKNSQKVHFSSNCVYNTGHFIVFSSKKKIFPQNAPAYRVLFWLFCPIIQFVFTSKILKSLQIK